MNPPPNRPRLALVPDPADPIAAGAVAAAAGPAELLERIRALHTPVTVCRGCCSLTCSGQCVWSEEYGGELLVVCGHCCIDAYIGKQNYVCLDIHHHGEEYGPPAICTTIAILDGARGPEEEQVDTAPRAATRVTLNPVTENPTGAGTTGYDPISSPGRPAGSPPPARPR